MGIRQEILTVLRGGQSERAPWAIADSLVSRGFAERELRNKGLGLIGKRVTHKESMPHVDVETRSTWENGERTLRRTYHTPVGSISQKVRFGPDYFGQGRDNEWIVEYMVKSVADYDVVRFMIEDTVYEEDHEGFAMAQRRLGDDGVILARMGRSPLQRLSIELAGFERLAIDLNDHTDVVEDLLRVMAERQGEVYRIGVESTAELIWAPDNISTSRLSRTWFERYLLPFYNRYAPMVHEAGKLYLCHVDGFVRGIEHLIARCDLDVIEALTPRPMGDISISEALEAWPDKAVWCNFPESVLLEDDSAVRAATVDLLEQGQARGRFVLGIVENYPEERMEGGLGAITEAVAAFPSD